MTDRTIQPEPTRHGWTSFWDMSSGGGQKTDYKLIYIEAPEAEAKRIFEREFDRDPDHETCSCCGPDFSIDEHESLEQATGYHRDCDHDRATGLYVERPRYKDVPFTDLTTFCAREDVLVLRKAVQS